MTDPERIELLERAIILMCKCLDVSRVQKLSDRQLNDLMRCIASISGDISVKGGAENE